MKPVAWIKVRELDYMKAVAQHGKGVTEGFCIASQCAMWRWSNPAEPVNYLRLGYCGLAGKPNA